MSIVGRFACTGADDIPAVTALQDEVVLKRIDPSRPLAGIPTADADASNVAGRFWAEARTWSTAFPAPAAEAGYQELFELLWADDAADARSSGYAAGVAGLEEATKGGHAPVFDGWTVGLHFFDYNTYVLGLGTIDEDRWKIANEKERVLVRATACRLGLWGILTRRPTAGIQYADGGSLTITISHDEPTDAIARANWLPAPDAAFRLVFRLYMPGKTILTGAWSYPQVRKLTPHTIGT